jgi:hypothetical protein
MKMSVRVGSQIVLLELCFDECVIVELELSIRRGNIGRRFVVPPFDVEHLDFVELSACSWQTFWTDQFVGV